MAYLRPADGNVSRRHVSAPHRQRRPQVPAVGNGRGDRPAGLRRGRRAAPVQGDRGRAARLPRAARPRARRPAPAHARGRPAPEPQLPDRAGDARGARRWRPRRTTSGCRKSCAPRSTCSAWVSWVRARPRPAGRRPGAGRCPPAEVTAVVAVRRAPVAHHLPGPERGAPFPDRDPECDRAGVRRASGGSPQAVRPGGGVPAVAVARHAFHAFQQPGEVEVRGVPLRATYAPRDGACAAPAYR